MLCRIKMMLHEIRFNLFEIRPVTASTSTWFQSSICLVDLLFSGRLNYFMAMNQEYIRKKIISLSKELAETTDYNEIKKLRKRIAMYKNLYTPTDPKSLTDLISGK